LSVTKKIYLKILEIRVCVGTSMAPGP
jgi:hypothetical protein